MFLKNYFGLQAQLLSMVFLRFYFPQYAPNMIGPEPVLAEMAPPSKPCAEST
jgi:hypothetical protein